MRAQPRRDLVAADRMRIAGTVIVAPAHQIDMDVIVVKRIGARRQHGGELLAGARLHVMQERLLLRRAVPAMLHVELRPSASVKAAMSSALPKACSEIVALGSPFMPRQE